MEYFFIELRDFNFGVTTPHARKPHFTFYCRLLVTWVWFGLTASLSTDKDKESVPVHCPF